MKQENDTKATPESGSCEPLCSARFGRGDPEAEARRLKNLRKANARPRTAEHIEKLSAALKARWASGTRKKNPESARQKAAQTMRQRYAEGRVKMPSPDDRRKWASKGGRTVTPLQLEKCRANARLREGVPGVGGNVAGEANSQAHRWIIRSPRGKIYEFTNLAHWARNNEKLFLPDERWESKTPLCKRISKGISMLYERQGRSCSYRGWTAVSRLELVNGSGDLLGRDVSLPNAPAEEPVGFPATTCSQCGQDFGPGSEGFSHCEDHRKPPTVPQPKPGRL